MDDEQRSKMILSIYASISLLVIYLQGIGFQSTIFPIILRIIAPAFAIYYGIKAVKFFGLGSVQGKSVAFMTAAMIFSWVGNIFWVAGTSTSFFIANTLYILIRPIFAFGIFYSITLLDKDFFKGKKLMMVSLLMALIGVIYFYIFYFMKDFILASKNIFLSAFIFFDFFLLSFAILTVYFIFLSFKGSYSRIWVALGLGTFFFWLSETAYVFNYDTYSLYRFIELGWAFGYVLFALSFAMLKTRAEKFVLMMAAKKKNV